MKILAKALKRANKESQKSGNEVLKSSLDYLETVEPQLLNREQLPKIKESLKERLDSLDRNLKKSEAKILEALEREKEPFPPLNESLTTEDNRSSEIDKNASPKIEDNLSSEEKITQEERESKD